MCEFCFSYCKGTAQAADNKPDLTFFWLALSASASRFLLMPLCCTPGEGANRVLTS